MGNSFGLKASVVAKKTQRRSSREHAARAIGDGLSYNEAMDRLMDQADPRTSIAHALTQARQLDLELHRRDSQTRAAELASLREFSAARTTEIWDAVVQSCPELGSLAPRLNAVPLFRGVTALEAQTDALARDARVLSGIALRQGARTCNLTAAVKSEFARANKLVASMDAVGDQRAATEDRADTAESSCWKAGHCLHTARGKQLYLFRNRLLRALKAELGQPPECSDKRAKLAESKVVVCFEGRPASEEDGLGSLWGFDCRYYNVADMWFSPFGPVLCHMLPVEDEELELVAPGPDELPLKARSGQWQ